MSGRDIAIACRCGAFRAEIQDASPKTGSHLICYCKDCQAGAHALGADEILKPRGGSDIFQTLPNRFRIVAGAEHLACLRLSPKGVLRWYASCCDTPVCTTLPSPKLAFVGVLTALMQGDDVGQMIGPVTTVVHTKFAQPGPGTLRDRGFAKLGLQVLRRHFGAVLKGTARDTPFFDDARQPVVEPRILTLAERQAATPD
ncbi:DUF6151 family protein [Shimia abyssi]|uniref:CENP-V/GFA domain-containing protein n=1 Tax=Shimia abyssi TaxID=1662395 RepID=A0A2P8FE82_9RHOB|nr:DUF6151 family protein [Shimia abyssi]PSL20029.1 hypothetical protein CLV88_10488 [Shimia abyssi]